MLSEFIDTPSALTTFLDRLPDCKGQPPNLYLDLEGNNLSRHGTLSLITILVQPGDQIHLVDVTSLKQSAFTTISSSGITLKDILEDSEIPKVFFDIRNDSSALFWLYDVRVQEIEDLQLFEYASRNFEKRCVNGLAKCIERDSKLGWKEKQQWQEVKNKGRKLFAPELGCSYAVFDKRPLSSEVEDYCTQDVLHMPVLREKYLSKLCDARWLKMMGETKRRIELSQSESFNGKGRHMAMGPYGWAQWQPARHERQKCTLFQGGRPRTTQVRPLSSEDQQSAPNPKDELVEDFQSLTFGDDESSLPASVRSKGVESDEDRDLTACDSECGYCGRCAY